MINKSTLENSKVEVSIVEIDDRKVIVYLNRVGSFKVMLEDIDTRERAFSEGSFKCPEEAFEDAFKRLS